MASAEPSRHLRRGLAAVSILLLAAAGASAAGASRTDAAWKALDAHIEACSARHGYDDDRAGDLGPHELGEGERAWRQCVYEGIERLVVPATRIPGAYRKIVAEDRRMTDAIERGEMTRAERRARLDSMVAALERGEQEVEMRELETMRDDLKSMQAEMRRMRQLSAGMGR